MNRFFAAFDTENPDECMNQAAQLAIALGLDPDSKRISENITQLVENMENENTDNVPEECITTFAYLEEKHMQSIPGSFEYDILELKKELREIETNEQLSD